MDECDAFVHFGMGVVTTVMSFALPGSGPIIKMLTVVGGQCKNMKQSADVCKTVYQRLQHIMKKMLEMEEKRTLPDAKTLTKYATVLQTFHDLLEKHLSKNSVLRIASSALLNEKIREIHEEIDDLFRMLNLAFVDEMMDWKRQYQHDQQQQQQQFKVMMSDVAAILSELRDQRSQQEAVTMLKFEADHRSHRHTKDQLDMINSAFRKIVSVSQVKVEAIPPWFLPPDEVDYNPKPFSQGSFGAAHRGKWGLGTAVVVKTLLVDTAGNDRAMKAFLREIDLWHKLNHPHVIKMYGACHVSSPPYIVCEDAVNGNLEDYLAKSTNQNKTWRLLHQAALGLSYLHDRKVVHGDLKCNNILVGKDGMARIADFGLSFVRSRSSNMSAKEQTGAVRWKAPECLRAMNPSLMSDLYSFGMVILEAVAGEPPWGMAADEDVRYAVVTEGRLPERPKDMSDRAWGLVQGMCHSEPQQRLPLAKVIEVLEALATEEANNDRGERVLCEQCNFPNNSEVRFCGGCGQRLAKPESSVGPTVSMSAPHQSASTCGRTNADSRSTASMPQPQMAASSYQVSPSPPPPFDYSRVDNQREHRTIAGHDAAMNDSFHQSPETTPRTSFDLYVQRANRGGPSGRRGRENMDNQVTLNPFDVKRGRSTRNSLGSLDDGGRGATNYGDNQCDNTNQPPVYGNYGLEMNQPRQPVPPFQRGGSKVVDDSATDNNNETQHLLATLRAGDPKQKQHARLYVQKKMRMIALDIGATNQTTALMELLEHAADDEDKIIAAKLLGVIISLGDEVTESIVDQEIICTCLRVVSAPSTPVKARRQLGKCLLGLPDSHLKHSVESNQVVETLVEALKWEKDPVALDNLTACVKHLTLGEPMVAEKLVRAGAVPTLLRLKSMTESDSARYADSTLKFVTQTKAGKDAVESALRRVRSMDDVMDNSSTHAQGLRRQATMPAKPLSVPEIRQLIQSLSGTHADNSAYALLMSMRENPDSIQRIAMFGGVPGFVTYLQQEGADLETATSALALLAQHSPARSAFIAKSDAFATLNKLSERGNGRVRSNALAIVTCLRANHQLTY